jgi:N-acetylglucosaminyldiphosphoundecaprenol N-acetyl-beta-D-mannosaminyltransferase
MHDLNRSIEAAVTSNRRILIANHNQHALYLYHRYEKMRKLYACADLIHIDGMPLVYWGKILGYPLRREHRTTYVDWIEPLMAAANRQNWRVYYLGSRPGVAERGAAVFRGQFQGLQITVRDGYFDATPGGLDNQQVLDEISAYRPHVLMVGMGMPRQEYWVLDTLDQIHANAVLMCGAAIDYVAGAVPTPPRWLGAAGLEWLFRLVNEPRRLGYRYLIEPWFLSGLLFRDLWRRIRR